MTAQVVFIEADGRISSTHYRPFIAPVFEGPLQDFGWPVRPDGTPGHIEGSKRYLLDQDGGFAETVRGTLVCAARRLYGPEPQILP